ncbi:uncharacterized protein LOC121690512 [Alosa sapidissima]|uniref:uncharacterized protein LOC121690512 n=1 Tax=Alosa sapidissima TaxID=34773 RepID=UPI001C08CB0D|nr:uncharacterized protein LOC121690512 [Alosa sapidissima]
MEGNQEEDCWSMEDLDEDDGSWRIRRVLKAKRLRENKEKEEKWNVVRFDEDGGVKSIDPINLTKIIKNQVGEVKYARILSDGNLLIGCVSEEQVGRAEKLQTVGKTKVVKSVKVGDQGSKGVIYGIPLSVDMKELVKNIKEKCDAVQSAKRLTRGFEKTETESVVIQFSTKELPLVLYFGYMRYNVREFTHKPMRCFNCQFAFVVQGWNIQTFKRTSNFLSVFTVELYAILMAVQWTEQIQTRKVLICSDSVSAINSLGKGLSKSRQDLIYEILLAIRAVKRRGVEMSFLWVPAHVGIRSNEKADKLTKKAVEKEAIDVHINLSKSEGKSIVWQEIILKWQQLWEQENQGRPLFSISSRVRTQLMFLKRG